MPASMVLALVSHILFRANAKFHSRLDSAETTNLNDLRRQHAIDKISGSIQKIQPAELTLK